MAFCRRSSCIKTNLSAAAVREFIDRAGAATRRVPVQPEHSQQRVFPERVRARRVGASGSRRGRRALRSRASIRPQRLDELVSDSRNTVHSNYFIAKPRFWRAWLAVNERLFAIAESADDPLGAELRAPTAYRGRRRRADEDLRHGAHGDLAPDARRTPSRAQARDPFAARSRIYKLPLAVVCDALKIAYATQGRRQYRDVFLLVQRSCAGS